MKHGTIYLNKNRYWWKVKLPGSNKLQQIALKPQGAKFATKELTVAREVAKSIWKQAQTKGTRTDGRTITDLVSAYMEHCRTYYQNSKEADNVWYALDFLQNNTDVAYAEDFTPLQLQELREMMIDKGLARSVINKRIGMLKRMFKWAASQQLAPVSVYQALATVENLRAGRSRAKENPENQTRAGRIRNGHSAILEPDRKGYGAATTAYRNEVIRTLQNEAVRHRDNGTYMVVSAHRA